jgi:hypothetical protein
MNKTKQKTYSNILVFLLTASALFYAGSFYLTETVKNLSLEVIEKKQAIEKLNKQSEQADSIKRGYKYMQIEMDKVSDLVVNYSDIAGFIVEIENVAEKSKVDLDISVSDKEKKLLDNNLSYVSYNIEASGKFDNLMHFLVYVENLKYFNSVESIRMRSDNKNNKNLADSDEAALNKIILNANLKVYVKNIDNKL